MISKAENVRHVDEELDEELADWADSYAICSQQCNASEEADVPEQEEQELPDEQSAHEDRIDAAQSLLLLSESGAVTDKCIQTDRIVKVDRSTVTGQQQE